MSCKHKERGKPSIEWYKNGKPQYYCYGFGHKETGKLLEVCQNCRQNVVYAQDDLDAWNKKEDGAE